jgi:phosphoribosyl 1,2-cyclic phosphate phosphodiesterase
VCTSRDPRNRRFRPSILVSSGNRNILVDTTPELRLQALAFDIRRVDAVLFTHAHADHIFGLDDMRRFNDLQGEPISVYADASVLDDIRRIYSYMFRPVQVGGGIPRVNLHEVQREFELFGIPIRSFYVMHGRLSVLAYRFGQFAYVTDTNYIPDEALEQLQGVEVLMLDAVRYDPHPTHFGLWEAVECAQRIGAKRTLFTHLSHHFDHATVNSELPAGMELAYDGLEIECPLHQPS